MLEMAPRILRNIFRNWVFAIQELVKQCEDLKVKYNEEMTERKKLFNELQESKGNIRVFCRCRPLNKDEISAGCTTVLDFGASKDGILTTSMPKKQYRFDRVYTPKDDQVYANSCGSVFQGRRRATEGSRRNSRESKEA
ncbi:kinesin-like protein KIN-14R isoform X2 [Arachis hypogaea]|uniref:kinesin-like protein KIN-14R isoform X2 n=1 Tax=Arachis hypogaea TaxID=3818 RepID=UPI003B228EF6